MKIKLLTAESFHNWPEGKSGSSRIRGRWIAENWEGCEEYKIGDKCDVMIYQKAYWQEHMEEFKGIKILDICDPDHLDGMGVKEVASHMDAFVVPTEALKKEFAQFVRIPIFVIPDRFDIEEFARPKTEHTGKAKTCVYYGYSNNARALKRAFSSLIELDLDLTLISDKDPRKTIAGFDHPYNFVQYEFASLHATLKKHDFVLLPKSNSKRFKLKSNNKTIESYLIGMPVAHTYDDMVKYMKAENRQKDSEANLKMAMDEYLIDKSVDQWKEVIKQLS